METSNTVSTADAALDRALFLFGRNNAVNSETAKMLESRGDLLVAQMFFSGAADFIEFAEFTPSGMVKWSDLQHRGILAVSEGRVSDHSKPIPSKSNESLLFTVERIQAFITENETDEMFRLMGGGTS